MVLVLDLFLDVADLLTLYWVNYRLRKLVPEIHSLLKVDWRPLIEPRFDYEDKMQTDMHIVDMAMALPIPSGLGRGKILRTTNGE